MFSIAFYTRCRNFRLTSCLCSIATIHFSIVFYAHQGNSRLVICFCGIARIRISITFYIHLGSIRLTNCCCRIARAHVFYCVLHELLECQANELLLQDRPNSCFLLCFTRVGGVSGQRVASEGSPELIFSIVFYTHQGNSRLANCFSGIPRIRIVYCVLHASGVSA